MTRIFSRAVAAVLAMLASAVTAAAGDVWAYADGDTALEGYLALPEGEGKLPGVLIVHQWMGITEHEEEVAERLAEAGYAALACDIYGKGERPDGPAQAGAYAGRYKGDVALFRRRLQAGLDALRAEPRVDPERLAVIGYCFGGTGALELGRSGADVKAIVSFHGGLSTPDPDDAKNIRGSVLICHGGDDIHVPDAELLGVMNELRRTEADWQVMVFGNAVHGFTHRHDAERYDAKAEARAWDAMMALFRETLAPGRQPVERNR